MQHWLNYDMIEEQELQFNIKINVELDFSAPPQPSFD